MSSESSKKKLLHELAQLIASKAGREQSLLVDALAKAYFRSFPAEDLVDWMVDDLYGFIYGCFRSLDRWDGKTVKVKIFNPDLEKHGWESHHSVVVLIAPDMPFLLDSARGELNRHNSGIHKLHGQNFLLQRDADGTITDIAAKGEEGSRVSLIYFEIDRASDPSADGEITSALKDILAEVSKVVDDFPAMREKLIEVQAMVKADTFVDSEQRAENADFLNWLSQNHITLLGYECLGVQYSGDRINVVDVAESRLGLLADRRTSGVQDLYNLLQHGHNGENFEDVSQLTFSKSRRRSRVHRFAYPDYIEINQFDDAGKIILQHRFMGLYTSAVYTQSPRLIPIVRLKIAQLMHESGVDESNHEGRELARVLELFPRDELFHANVGQLYRMASAVNQIQERRQTRFFARAGAHGKFFSGMVYMPRDRYTTAKRIQIERMLKEELGAEESEFSTTFSESVLVRVYFVFLLKPGAALNYNIEELEANIIHITQSWQDRLRTKLLDQYGEEQGVC